MKLRGRTVILCCIALQMTLLYSTSYEIVKYLSREDHSDIKGFSDLTNYLWIFSCTSILALTMKALLFGFGMAPHFSYKKLLVLVFCAIQVIVILPFNLSGFYLAYQTRGDDSVQMSNKTVEIYEEFSDYVNESSFLEYKINNASFPAHKLQFDTVISLNSFYCCCGLQHPREFGTKFEANVSARADLSDKQNFTCPFHKIKSISNETLYRCNVKEFEGCATKLPRLHKSLIIVSNSIFTVCTLISYGLTIPIYASFEFDRRKARTVFIRRWIEQTKREIEIEKRKLLDEDSTQESENESRTNISKTEKTQTEATKLESSDGNNNEKSKTPTEKTGKSQKSNK